MGFSECKDLKIKWVFMGKSAIYGCEGGLIHEKLTGCHL